MLDACPDTYDDCDRSDSYQVSSDGCNTLANYFYSAGGQKVQDRLDAHTSVAGNAMHQSALAALKARRVLSKAKSSLVGGDITEGVIADGVRDLEDKGLQVGENVLCSWATGATGFCRFLVNTPVVQRVNNDILNMPVAAQVTHQIATLAEGAIQPVADAVNGAVRDVATAINAGREVVQACKTAATNIVHSVLNFFNWMEEAVFAAVTGKRGRVPLPASLPVASESGDILV
jgi:hypothetical protein